MSPRLRRPGETAALRGFLAGALTGAVLFVSACGSGPVQVQSPQPGPSASRACHRLHARLPDTLEGQPRRATEPSSRLVAAWGSPPIVLRCGVNEPGSLRLTSRLAVVNGVEWFPETDGSPLRYTTVHRAANVELSLPREYGAPADVLVRLAAPIKKTVPAADS